jgi:hypothetical protein
VSRLWPLLQARLPLGGISTLPAVLRTAMWHALRSDGSLTFSTQDAQQASA